MAKEFIIKYDNVEEKYTAKEEEVLPTIHIESDVEKHTTGSISVPLYKKLWGRNDIRLDTDDFRIYLNEWLANEKEWDVNELWSYNTLVGIRFYLSKDGTSPQDTTFIPHNPEKLQ